MDPSPRLLTLICLLPFTLLSGCGDKEPVKKEIIRPVKAFKVGGAGGISGRSFPGRARAHQEVDLSFRVAGPLIVLPNDLVGREFKKDDLIARIDPRDYEVKVRDVEGQLERAQANAARAQTLYQRELNILKEDPGATSQTSVDQKRAQRDQSIAEVKSLEASLDAAKDNLSYTYLKAPFDGTIVAEVCQQL